MEIFNRERNPRDGDDDEEAFGAFGDPPAKKQEYTPPPPLPEHNTYHSLHHGAAGEFTLRNQPSIIGKWLEAPQGAPESLESDDDDDDEETEKEKQQAPSATEATQYAEPPEHYTETVAPIAQTAPTPMAYEPTPVTHPVHESLSADGEQPAWLAQDKQKFEQIMQQEASTDFAKAASGELLTDTESGRPAAIENAVNESEPVHPVTGYHAEQEQQFQGYTPGVGHAQESAWQPSASVSEHTPQPAWANQAAAPMAEARPSEQSPSAPYTPTVIRPNSFDTHRAEQVGLRRGLIAGFVTGYALKGFLASRKLKREQRQQKEEIEKQQEAATQLTAQQQAMRQQIVRQNEQIAGLQAQQATERYAPPAVVVQPQAEARPQQSSYVSSAESGSPIASERPLYPATERQPQVPAPVPEAAPSSVSAERPRVEMPTTIPAGMKTETAPDNKLETDEAKAAADHEAAARRAVEEAREAEAAAAQENQQRVEQDAWLRHVLDKEGHEVQGAVHYGREYTEERAHETKGSDSATMFPPPGGANTGQRQKAAGPTSFFGRTAAPGGGAQPAQPHYTPPSQPTYGQDYRQAINSGLTPPDHSLPAGMPRPADWQRRLAAKKQGTFVSALTSPWLFLMLSLILLAYFIATLL